MLSLVLSLICFAFQICHNMWNATLLFCILALTSSSVPPVLLTSMLRIREGVCFFQWFPSKCDWVIVLRVGFHGPCLASVDVESYLC